MSERLRLFVVMVGTALVVALCLEFLPSSPLHGTLTDSIRGTGARLNGEVTSHTEGSHAWVMTQPGKRSTPVSYDPCRAIAVVVNPSGAPTGSVALLRTALARVNQVTGLDLEYAGLTDAQPRWDDTRHPIIDAGGTPPVLISWATPAQFPALDGEVAGIAASIARAGALGRLTFVTGQVTLDADDFAALSTAQDGRARMRAVVLHELGHLVGLAHVRDRGELMNARLEVLDYGPGDLQGLARLGRGGCH